MLFKSSHSEKNTANKTNPAAKDNTHQVFTFIDNMPYEAKTITLSQEELDKLKEQQKNKHK